MLQKIITTAFIIVSAKFCYSQKISITVAKLFPGSIVTRMYNEVTSKTALSESSQLWLAKSYYKQDSLIAALIIEGKKGETEIQWIKDSTDIAIEFGLKKVMTWAERNSFQSNVEEKRVFALPVYKGATYEGAEMHSLMGIALNLKNQLALTDTQCVNILKSAVELKREIDFSNATPDSGYFDKEAYEITRLSDILDEYQINLLLANKNKKAAELQARYDWYELSKLGLSQPFKKDNALKEMTLYHILIAHITDRYAGEKEKRALLYTGIKMPDPLTALLKAKTGNTAKLEKYVW